MTHQPSETKSPSTRFTVFPNYYAIIHSTKDAPQWMNEIRQEEQLSALLKQQKKLITDIAGLRYQLSIEGLNPGSQTQKNVSQQLSDVEAQYAKVTRNIELCKYLSDEIRRARYEKFYQQILASAPSTELEKTLLAQWNSYNTAMNKASLSSSTSSPSPSIPAEQKSSTGVIPQNNNDADLQKALAESKQTFFAEEQRRAEQRQQAELQKQLTDLLKNYSDLKKEYALEDIAILLEEPLKQLNSAFPRLNLAFSQLENLTTENNEHKTRLSGQR